MSLYYRDSHAAILVFDYSNPQSLEGLKYWLNELDDRINTNDIIIKIAGNKFDLLQKQENKIIQDDVKNTFKKWEGLNLEVINTSALHG